MIEGLRPVSGDENLYEMPQPMGLYAGDLLRRSLEYFKAFKLCEDNAPGEIKFAQYFCLSHALECGIKSYLAMKGVNKSMLRGRGMGHNIDVLISEANILGLDSDEIFVIFCNSINEMNSDYDFRYPTNYNLRVPPPKTCIEMMDYFYSKISRDVRSCEAKANLVFSSDTRHLQGKKIQWSD